MAAFIQIIEWRSSRIADVLELGRSRRAEMEGQPDGPVRLSVTTDRNDPLRHMTIVEFSSYESAMRNSQAPSTSDFAARMAELCDGPPVFHDLDVAESWDR